MDQSQNEFLIEIGQLVEQIFADLDRLRELRGPQADGRVRRQLIDSIFRRVHSVKGSAASCGLDSLSQLAHEFENLLEALRSGHVLLDDAVLDTCESATNALTESLAASAQGLGQQSQSGVFEKLRATVSLATGQTLEPDDRAEAILKRLPAELQQTLADIEKHRLASIIKEGNTLFVVQVRFELANFDAAFSRLKEKLAEFGEILSTSPTIDANHPSKISFRLLYASTAGAKDIEDRVKQLADVTLTTVGQADDTKPAADTRTDFTTEAFTSLPSVSNFVQTDLDTLDQVISATHELFRLTSNALGLAAEPSKISGQESRTLREQIGESFKALEADLIGLRLVSLGPTLQRAARAGRAAARLAGKEVDFEVVGAELRIDKLLAEAIGDPLIHLVRNAVDHGIENPHERARAGKKSKGRIRIEALNEGSQTRLRVADDGRGIDPVLVSSAARRLGVVEPDVVADFEQSMRLIFRPGFSTLSAPSEVSGRGVGLDVVETMVEQVGGELRVSSALERGTTFEIRLPVTFSLLNATVFVSGTQRYCIPASQVIAVQMVDKTNNGSSQLMRADGLPLFSLRELLGQTADSNTNDLHKEASVIIFQPAREPGEAEGDSSVERIGLLVDSVDGTEQILVRNLGRHAGRWYGVSGATELRDGSVALVLDLPRLLSGSTSSNL